MTNEFEFFHGLVFARIVHGTRRSISIKTFRSASNAAYVINGTIGLYVKYSAKRMTPWRFTFKQEHQIEIARMSAKLEAVFLILVCNDDGIVCLDSGELAQILSGRDEPIEWISASRQRRQMYAIRGSNGELDFKIGQNEFPAKLFNGR